MQPTRTITLETLITKQLPFQMSMLVKRNMAPYWLTIWRQPIQRHFRAVHWTKMDSDRFIEAIQSPRLSLGNLGHRFYVSHNGVYLSWDIYSCVSEITLVKLMDGWVCFCQTPVVLLLLFPAGKDPTTKSFNACLCTKCETKIVSQTKNDLVAQMMIFAIMKYASQDFTVSKTFERNSKILDMIFNYIKITTTNNYSASSRKLSKTITAVEH